MLHAGDLSAAEGTERPVRTRAAENGSTRPPFSASAATLLIADDDPVVVHALREDLEPGLYRLISAASGRECLDVLQREPVDLVLLDLMMPDLSGFDVLRCIAGWRAGIAPPVIVLSSSARDTVDALKAGAVDYLTKPWHPEELLARVGTHVRLKQREAQLADTVSRLDQHAQALENEMTERKRAEAQLLMAGRMSSVGVVAAGIAHEVNNPLTYLIGNLELLRDKLHAACGICGLPVHALERMAEHALDGAERVRVIVRDLKAFSRPDTDETEPVDLAEVLESVLRLSGHEIKHRAQIIREIEPLPPVFGNAARLSQVFLNIVANAAHAMTDGSPERDALRITAKVAERGCVEVRLTDTGVGMDAHALAHAFEMFYTTKHDHSGTGLGLALCRKIVEGFGGSIHLTSEPRHGTQVLVRLQPFSRDLGASHQPDVPQDARVERLRVLVVDDEPEICSLIGNMLPGNFEVESAESASAALELLRRDQSFDVVLCDLMLGGMTGMELYELSRQNWPDLASRFVFMTGGTCTAQARAFVEQQESRTLDKPFSLSELIAALQTQGRP